MQYKQLSDTLSLEFLYFTYACIFVMWKKEKKESSEQTNISIDKEKFNLQKEKDNFEQEKKERDFIFRIRLLLFLIKMLVGLSLFFSGIYLTIQDKDLGAYLTALGLTNLGFTNTSELSKKIPASIKKGEKNDE